VNIALVVIIGLLLVGFAGLLAATEAALAVFSKNDLLSLAQNSRTARSLAAIANDLRAHRNVTTFVRIVSETVVAVLVTGSLVASNLQLWVALLVAAFVMVGVSFVLAGSSPRSVGRAHPHGVVAFAAPIVHILRVVLGPLADVLVTLGDRVTPGRPGTSSFTSEEQLLSMVDEAVRHDVLEDEERELIHSIFEWDDTVVREVMVPRVDMVTCESSLTLREAAALFTESGFSRLPVIGDDVDDIRGVLYLRDVARRSWNRAEDLDTVTAGQVIRPANFMPESKKADAALKEMQARATHLALVVDEYGGIAGLVTLEDLIEELVGEISDEHDRGKPDVEALAGDKFRVSSRLHIEDLGDLFGIDLEDEDIDSVGGLMAKELGRIAVVGDRVVVSGLVLEADRSDAPRGRVTRILAWADEDLKAAEKAFLGEEESILDFDDETEKEVTDGQSA
jgi:CBS domain containing-hemolysin-like protein